MADFKDVMKARDNAAQSTENMTLLMEKFDPTAIQSIHAITTLTAATAICMYLRSLECTIDYIVPYVSS